MADWFAAFCEVHARDGDAGALPAKKAAVKRRRTSRDAAAGAAGEDTDAAGPSGAGKGGGGKAGQQASEEEKARRRELAARFSQATSELQLLGLIKPARRRRGDFVQRLVHMPALE